LEVSDVTKYSVTVLECEFCKIAVVRRNYSRSSIKVECRTENKYWFSNTGILQKHQGFDKTNAEWEFQLPYFYLVISDILISSTEWQYE
jgi:hypothetical protein